jgi:hypothetical protein
MRPQPERRHALPEGHDQSPPQEPNGTNKEPYSNSEDSRMISSSGGGPESTGNRENEYVMTPSGEPILDGLVRASEWILAGCADWSSRRRWLRVTEGR